MRYFQNELANRRLKPLGHLSKLSIPDDLRQFKASGLRSDVSPYRPGKTDVSIVYTASATGTREFTAGALQKGCSTPPRQAAPARWPPYFRSSARQTIVLSPSLRSASGPATNRVRFLPLRSVLTSSGFP
jgi:hypothetical protein